MVIEFLTFEVGSDIRREWLETEERVWGSFLSRQPGFLRRERWIPDDKPTTVHTVIWWDHQSSWDAVSPQMVREVDSQMGELAVVPSCRTFYVVGEA